MAASSSSNEGGANSFFLEPSLFGGSSGTTNKGTVWFTKSAEISWGEVTRGTLLKKARIFNIAKGKVKKNCEVVGFMSSFYILDLQVVCCWNFVERWLIHLDLPGPTRELGVSIFARCGTQ